MPTKEPTPPPPRRGLCEHQDAELILNLAVRWRRSQVTKDSIAETAYAISLVRAIDGMVHDLANPPTSPPPPKPK